jgi:hypothetical protein
MQDNTQRRRIKQREKVVMSCKEEQDGIADNSREGTVGADGEGATTELDGCHERDMMNTRAGMDLEREGTACPSFGDCR